MSNEKVTSAYVLVKTDVGKAGVVLQDILSLSKISKAVVVTGDYDIVIEVTAPNIEKLMSWVARDIQQIRNIKETKTLICAKVEPSIPRGMV